MERRMKNLEIMCYIISSIFFGMGFYLLFVRDRHRIKETFMNKSQKDKKIKRDIQKETVVLKRKENEYE